MTELAAESRESVGPYRLIRAIGSGGSARIDLARIDRAYNFQRHVVIKRPLEHLRSDPAVAASLHREARIGGRLRHPNLVAVLDAGVHDGYDYLVLEYIHGASLRTLMQTEVGGLVREVPLPVALGIAIDVARGIHDAHELRDENGRPLGLVHRDVSPGNVLLGLDGAVKLADFGIAKETRVSTLSGSIHGTVTYMAPEQCRGHAFDRRADLFSIGVILYELVTQRRLFWADNDVASLHRVLSGQVVPPRKIKPTLSAALEDIVMTAVATDPERRFATARAFADALENLAASEGHVVGARWLARTVEDVVGAKHAPWIAATTVVEPARAGTGDGSLVEVIESLESQRADSEPVYPTFGPSDERAADDDPSIAVSTPPPPPRASRRGVIGVIVAGAVGGIALAIGLGLAGPRWSGSGLPRLAGSSSQQSATALAPDPVPVAIPAVVPAPAPVAAPAPAPAVPDPAPEPAVTDPIATHPIDPIHHRHHHPRVTATTPPALPPPTPVPDPVAPAAGSAAKPHSNVEWKPTMLLPTDSGKPK